MTDVPRPVAGDDDVVPHPFGTGATASSGAGGPDVEPPDRPAGEEPADDEVTQDGAAEDRTADEDDARGDDEPDADGDAAEEDAPAEEVSADEGSAEEVSGGEVSSAAVSEDEADGERHDGPPPSPGAAPRRRRDPMAAILIGLLTMLLGFAFAVQVRTVGGDDQLAGAREEDLVRILDELDAQEERLRDQLAEQRSALEQLTNSDSQAATALEAARARAEAIGILNGTMPAQGPGLRMVVRDPADEVGVADLLDAIQELRGAGAETMQIDDVRVGVSTAVTGKPGALMVDGRPITAPYEILVIGSPQNMETAMNIPGGVVQRVNNRGGSVDITQSDEVVVDALRPLDTPQYASPQTDD
jgi:uncharacterized protein YlxW (UPF0749 family)